MPDAERADLTDLPRAQREGLLDAAAALADILKGRLAYPKVNVAALGNVVPQLHLHVIGRRPGDCCWPDPVWGRPLPGERWSAPALRELEGYLSASGLRPA